MQQLVLPMNIESVYLPLMPTKGELAQALGYAKVESLYTCIITEERVMEAGYQMAFIRSRRCRRIPPALASLIYQAEKIQSLR